jgi:hypothetical protein
LGGETQRQWSDVAIRRTTPVLLALFSLVVLLTQRLHLPFTFSLSHTTGYMKQHNPRPSLMSWPLSVAIDGPLGFVRHHEMTLST